MDGGEIISQDYRVISRSVPFVLLIPTVTISLFASCRAPWPVTASACYQECSQASSAPNTVGVYRWTAPMKAQRQSFANLYISAQPLCLYDDKAVRSRGNRDMYVILSNSLAGTRPYRRARPRKPPFDSMTGIRR